MAADLLVSEIVQAYGAYYLNSGQNLNINPRFRYSHSHDPDQDR